MANPGGTQGGSHEQHVKAGAQSHKNATTPPGKEASSGAGREKTGSGPRGPSEQQGKPGPQSPKKS